MTHGKKEYTHGKMDPDDVRLVVELFNHKYNLRRLIHEGELSLESLGKKCGVAPKTVRGALYGHGKVTKWWRYNPSQEFKRIERIQVDIRNLSDKRIADKFDISVDAAKRIATKYCKK